MVPTSASGFLTRVVLLKVFELSLLFFAALFSALLLVVLLLSVAAPLPSLAQVVSIDFHLHFSPFPALGYLLGAVQVVAVGVHLQAVVVLLWQRGL